MDIEPDIDYPRTIESMANEPWIPVSERLPEPNQEVLVVMEWYGKTINVIAKLYSYPASAWMFTFPRRPEEDSIWRYVSNGVLAWMPIPEYVPSNAVALLTEDKTLVPDWATPDEGQF